MSPQATLKSSTALAPTVLLPYQADSLVLARNHQLTVFEKSRRIGLSYAFAPFAVDLAAAGRAPQNVYYIGYNLDMAREFIGYCAGFARELQGVRVALPSDDDLKRVVFENDDGSLVGSDGRPVDEQASDIDAKDRIRIAEGGFLIQDDVGKSVKSFRIDFPNGKAVVALPSSPRSVRGKQGVFIVDEAAFHDNLEELIKAILAALMWGGRVIIISTHDGADNYFNTLIEEIRSGKRGGHVHRITFKDAIAAGLYRRIREASFAAPAGPSLSPEVPDNAEDELVDELIAESGYRAGKALTDPILGAIRAADSAEELQRLLAASPGDENQLANSIENASFALRLDEEAD